MWETLTQAHYEMTSLTDPALVIVARITAPGVESSSKENARPPA